MSQEQKLQTCFNWVIRKYYYIWRRFDEGGEYWPAVNANDHFVYGRGDCMAMPLHLLILPKALGYTNVYSLRRSTAEAIIMHMAGQRSTVLYMILFLRRPKAIPSITVLPIVPTGFPQFSAISFPDKIAE